MSPLLPLVLRIGFLCFPSTSSVSTMASCPNNHLESSQIQFWLPSSVRRTGKSCIPGLLATWKPLTLNTNEADNCMHTCWKQLKMMFKGEDGETLQSLINNGTITLESQKTPWACPWCYQYYYQVQRSISDIFGLNFLSGICQLPDKGIHALSTYITNLITNCKFPHAQNQEMLKIMVLQHAMWYHKTRNCIWLQD